MGKLHGVRVMVLDDDPDTLDAVCFYLETQGATVSCVASVAEALERLDFRPDVIVSTS